MENKISGISFSPYLEGQDPNVKSTISEKQIADRLEIIRPYTKWVRTFSTTNSNEEVPRIAHEKGLKTLVGAWIGDDKINNQVEIDNIISIAKKGYGDMIAIGNEVLLREDLEVEELIGYIQQVKQAVPHIPVGYVDAYYMYVNYPEIVDACDVIFANCYPFWEGKSVPEGIESVITGYNYIESLYPNKEIVITETGWATKSNHVQTKANIANEENQKIFNSVIDKWTEKNQITCFFFEAFDEPWKESKDPYEPEKTGDVITLIVNQNQLNNQDRQHNI